MSAVRKGESPQKTEVLVGALMPKARVPVNTIQRLATPQEQGNTYPLRKSHVRSRDERDLMQCQTRVVLLEKSYLSIKERYPLFMPA